MKIGEAIGIAAGVSILAGILFWLIFMSLDSKTDKSFLRGVGQPTTSIFQNVINWLEAPFVQFIQNSQGEYALNPIFQSYWSPSTPAGTELMTINVFYWILGTFLVSVLLTVTIYYSSN